MILVENWNTRKMREDKCESRDLQTFSFKGQLVNVVRFVSCTVFIASTQFSYCRAKTDTDNR